MEHTLNYWEPMRKRDCYLDNHKSLPTKRRIGMNDKINVLHKVTPSRLTDVAILANAQKPTQRIKEKEETEKYVSNKKKQEKLQK